MRLRPDIIKLDRGPLSDVPGEPATMALLEARVGSARRSERPFTRSEVNRARVIAYQLGALLHSERIGASREADLRAA